MALRANNNFDVDNSYSYIGKQKTFEGDEFESEIGDVKRNGEFLPQLKIKRWENEANFSVRIKDAGHVEPSIDDDKIVYITPEYTARFYYLQEGFEFDVTFPKKPSSRDVVFSIRRKQLAFYYQDPEVLKAKFERDTKLGLKPEIPEDIYGSYAVYHRKKRDHRPGQKNYRIGKAFHIKRPWAEDATGKRVWCDLNISTTKHTMTITLPEDFYNEAVWPVLVDPTFGYTTAGASNRNSLTNRAWGHGNADEQYNASSGDTVTTFHMYTRNTNDTAEFGIYDKNGGGNGGATLLSGSVTLTATSGTVQWETASANIALSAGNDHFIAYYSSNGIRQYYDTGTTAGDSTEDASISSALASSWTENYTDDELVSMYATYTEGSSGYTLAADSETFTYTAQAASLLAGRVLTSDSAGFTLTAQAAGLLHGRVVSADSRRYSLTAQSAGLLAGRMVTADSGSFTYTAQDATLTHSGGAYSLTADSSAYTFTGQSAGLLVSRVLPSDSESYTLTAQSAGLRRVFTLSSDSGSYSLTSQAADLLRTYVSESAAFTLTAVDATLTYSATASIQPTPFTLYSKQAPIEIRSRIKPFELQSRAKKFEIHR